MALIVHKYGGTSMGSTERIRNVAKRVAKWARAGHQMVHDRFCLDYMLRDIEAIYALAVGGDERHVPDRTGARAVDQR